MSLALVVPGLLSLPPATLRRVPALGTLASLARVDVVADGIEVATLRALGLDAAVAPLVARGAGLDPADDGWLCADPVVLVAGHDDVRLVGRVDDLARGEADALCARLNRHFAEDGIAFEVPTPDRWLARVRGRPLPRTTTLAAASGTALRELLPAGDDAATWRRWQNEIQMLLHDDPLNAVREARGQPPVSGLWFWGGGRDAALPRGIAGAADDGRGGDLVRGVVRAAHSGSHALPARLPPAWRTGTFAAALPAPADDRALGDVVEHWLSPALASVMRGELASLTLLADAGRAAASWRVERPSAFARLRARLVRAASFEVPPGVAPEEGERR